MAINSTRFFDLTFPGAGDSADITPVSAALTAYDARAGINPYIETVTISPPGGSAPCWISPGEQDYSEELPKNIVAGCVHTFTIPNAKVKYEKVFGGLKVANNENNVGMRRAARIYGALLAGSKIEADINSATVTLYFHVDYVVPTTDVEFEVWIL